MKIIGLALFTVPANAFPSEVELPNDDAQEPLHQEYEQLGELDTAAATVLLQTDMAISENMLLGKTVGDAAMGSPTKTSDVALNSVMHRVWTFFGCSDTLTAGATVAAENAKRFHRDFIAAALLMCCVLPWARRQEGETSHGSERTGAADESERSSLLTMSGLGFDFPNGLLHVFPAFHCLRYVSVLLLWLQHYWFEGSLLACQPLLLLVGLVLDFVETRRNSEDNIWTKYASAIPERFTRLYPLYALHVIICYLSFPLPGSSEGGRNFADGFNVEGSLVQRALSGTAWVVSVVFGSYILLPVLTDQPHDIPDNIVAMLSAACVALVVLPRTLAFPVIPSNTENDRFYDSSQDTAVAEMIFAHKTLLFGLAYFFSGVVIGRVCLAFNLDRYISMPTWFNRHTPDIKAEPTSEEADKPRVQQRTARLSEDTLRRHQELLDSDAALSADLLSDCLDSEPQ